MADRTEYFKELLNVVDAGFPSTRCGGREVYPHRVHVADGVGGSDRNDCKYE